MNFAQTLIHMYTCVSPNDDYELILRCAVLVLYIADSCTFLRTTLVAIPAYEQKRSETESVVQPTKAHRLKQTDLLYIDIVIYNLPLDFLLCALSLAIKATPEEAG